MLQGCTEFIAVEIHYNCQPNANNSLVAETMGVAESTACKEKKKKQHRQRRATCDRLRSKYRTRFHKPERNRQKLSSCLTIGVRPNGV